jgi:hypothetical protein
MQPVSSSSNDRLASHPRQIRNLLGVLGHGLDHHPQIISAIGLSASTIRWRQIIPGFIRHRMQIDKGDIALKGKLLVRIGFIIDLSSTRSRYKARHAAPLSSRLLNSPDDQHHRS